MPFHFRSQASAHDILFLVLIPQMRPLSVIILFKCNLSINTVTLNVLGSFGILISCFYLRRQKSYSIIFVVHGRMPP